jgi:DNA-binding transcriptional regulator LsrR (DeoR family)
MTTTADYTPAMTNNIPNTQQRQNIDIALTAVRLYAETHPRPPHVTQSQAAEMLNISRATVSRLVKSGALKLNSCGLIGISQIDKLLTTDVAS